MDIVSTVLALAPGGLLIWVLELVAIGIVIWGVWAILHRLPFLGPFMGIIDIVLWVVIALLVIYYVLVPLLSLVNLGAPPSLR